MIGKETVEVKVWMKYTKEPKAPAECHVQEFKISR
jgi:hypothetical protein